MDNNAIIKNLTQLKEKDFTKRTYSIKDYLFVFDVDKRSLLHEFLKHTLDKVVPVHYIKNDVVSILYALTGSVLTEENKLYCSDIKQLQEVFGEEIQYGENKILYTNILITNDPNDTEHYELNNVDLDDINTQFMRKAFGDSFRLDKNGKLISTFANRLNKEFGFNIARYTSKPTYQQLHRCAKYLILKDIPIPFEYDKSRSYDMFRIAEYYGLDSDMKEMITNRQFPLR